MSYGGGTSSGTPGPLRAFGGYGSTPAPLPFASPAWAPRSSPHKTTAVANPNIVRQQLRQGGGVLLCTCTIAGVGLCLALALVVMVDPPPQHAIVLSPTRQVEEICFSGGWTWNRMEWRYSDGSVDIVGFVNDDAEKTDLADGSAQPTGEWDVVVDFVGDPTHSGGVDAAAAPGGRRARRLERRPERHVQRQLSVQRMRRPESRRSSSARARRRLSDVVGGSEAASATAVRSTECTEPLTLDTENGEYITAVEGFDTVEDSDKYIGCEHRITTSTGRVQEWKKTGTQYCTGEQLDERTGSRYAYSAARCKMVTSLRWAPQTTPLISGIIEAPLLESMRSGRDAGCDDAGDDVPIFHRPHAQRKRAGAGFVMLALGFFLGKFITRARARACIPTLCGHII